MLWWSSLYFQHKKCGWRDRIDALAIEKWIIVNAVTLNVSTIMSKCPLFWSCLFFWYQWLNTISTQEQVRWMVLQFAPMGHTSIWVILSFGRALSKGEWMDRDDFWCVMENHIHGMSKHQVGCSWLTGHTNDDDRSCHGIGCKVGILDAPFV